MRMGFDTELQIFVSSRYFLKGTLHRVPNNLFISGISPARPLLPLTWPNRKTTRANDTNYQYKSQDHAVCRRVKTNQCLSKT